MKCGEVRSTSCFHLEGCNAYTTYSHADMRVHKGPWVHEQLSLGGGRVRGQVYLRTFPFLNSSKGAVFSSFLSQIKVTPGQRPNRAQGEV